MKTAGLSGRGASDNFRTPIDRLYTPPTSHTSTNPRSERPGAFPTRGIHASGYDGKLWTMRQFAGFGSPEDTNARYKALLAAGGTGLSVAFDLPTLMGRDPDHPLALGEVGKCGVSVTSLADMEALFDGISLGGITTSMTINSPAAMIFAVSVVAERQGADRQTLRHDSERHPQGYRPERDIFPPRPSMRIIADIFAFARARAAPDTISGAGTHPVKPDRRRFRNWRSRCATA
jgi:methylmalonyl-CoA mutase N-terminal domain/subunit